MAGKFAIIVHAGPQELARALHGLLYAQELHEAGHEVKLLFDGAGTTWVDQFEQPDFKYGPLYRAVKAKGVIAGVCEYCAGAFQAKDAVQRSGLPFLGEVGGHPSLSKLIAEGFAPIVI